MIITDYNIPSISGLDLLQKAKQIYLLQEKPFPKVVMLTEIEDPRLKERCFKDEMIDAFILKTDQNEVLEKTINDLIQT